MAASLNKVTLIGRLGRDPELRFTPNGRPVANFSIATDESFTSKDGNRETRTEWHKIVVWGKQAELVNNYLSKGRLAYIEGSLQTRKWEKDGHTNYTTEIVAQRVLFLDSRGGGGGGSDYAGDSYGGGSGGGGGSARPAGNDFPNDAPPMPDDDIPF